MPHSARPPEKADGQRNLPLATRAAPVNSVDVSARTVEVTWTTGATVDRVDWWTGERYKEELVVSGNAVRLDRLNAGGPVLDNHGRYRLDDQLAVVERAWIESGRGLATIRFPKAEDDENADRIFRKVSDGIIRSLSCGYRQHLIEVDKSQTPNVWRVVDWEPYEISFVLVPADFGAQVRAEDVTKFPCDFRALPAPNEARRIRMRMRTRALDAAR